MFSFIIIIFSIYVEYKSVEKSKVSSFSIMKLAIFICAVFAALAAGMSSSEEVDVYTKFLTAQINHFFENFESNLNNTLEGQDDR